MDRLERFYPQEHGVRTLIGLCALAVGAAGCSGTDGASPSEPPPAVASVVPGAGATGVNPMGPIVVRFTHPMMAGMEEFMALHEGGTPAGPVVAGQWAWSEGRTVIKFTPAAPLRAATRYTMHLGGGLRDRAGREVDHVSCTGQGGIAATPGMMSGSGMMGGGWRHSSGTYGMLFTFTTA